MKIGENQIIDGRYHLLENLGEGTVGQAFRVWDSARQDEIILKFLHPDLVESAGGFNAISPLLASIANLHHPGLASVFDYRFVDGHVLLCQERIIGQPLRLCFETPSKHTALSDNTRSLIEQLIDTVAYASNHLPMLCLNANNVWLTDDGQIRVTDTGLKQLSPIGNTIHVARQHHNESYLAPDWHQVKQTADLTSQADQFALGILILELSQGQRVATTLLSDQWSHQAQNLPLDRFLARLTAPKSRDRFSNCSAAKASFNQAVSQPSILKTLSPRLPRTISSVMILSLFLVSGLVIIFLGLNSSRHNAIDKRLQLELDQTRQLQANNEGQLRTLLFDLADHSEILKGVLPNLPLSSSDEVNEAIWEASADLRSGHNELVIESIAEIRQKIFARQHFIQSLTDTLALLDQLTQLNHWHAQIAQDKAQGRPLSRADLNREIEYVRRHLNSGYFSRAHSAAKKAVTTHAAGRLAFTKQLLRSTRTKQQVFQELLRDQNLPMVQIHNKPAARLETATKALERAQFQKAVINLQIADRLYDRWIQEWQAIPPPSPNHRVNSLGMRLVKVDDLYASVWETRQYDFAIFSQQSGHDSRRLWRENHPNAGITHPVASVTRYDAQVFCQWLTKRERERQLISQGQVYRLPSDREWSHLAGLHHEVGQTPEQRSWSTSGRFPWGDEAIRTPQSGNYDTWPSANPSNSYFGYMDPWLRTAPVGQFPPNSLGLYDIGGNVWEWVSDNFNQLTDSKTVRGGGWRTFSLLNMRIQARRNTLNDNSETGFRIILTLDPSEGRDENTVANERP